MSSAIEISLAEYLDTDYEPDCDFVDGMLEERNVGKQRHSEIQTNLSAWLVYNRNHGLKVRVEQRVQVSPLRVRVPDICLIDPGLTDEVLQRPPSLCIEILSPDDRWSRMQDRIDDYLIFGVERVWIIDPYTNAAWIATSTVGVQPVTEDFLTFPQVGLSIALSESSLNGTR